MQAGIFPVSAEDFAIFGMHGARNENASASCKTLGHEDGFGGSRGAVIHRSVGDFLAGELAHQRLKFKDRLQCALSDFGLIWGVRGKKFAAQENRVRDNGAEMIVDSRAQKAGVAERIFSGAFLEIIDDFGFRQGTGQFQRLTQPETFRYALNNFFDGSCADGGEHFLPLGGALWEIAHQAEASLPFAAMYAS